MAPATLVDTFDAECELDGDNAVLTLHGDLERGVLSEFQAQLSKMVAAQPNSAST